MIFRPAFFFFAGWTLMQMLGMAVKWKPLHLNWARWAARILAALLSIVFILTIWFVTAEIANQYLYSNYLRGEWIETINQATGTVDKSWRNLPTPVPEWVKLIVNRTTYSITAQFPFFYSLLGGIMWYLGVPTKKSI
jgi:uncharacterized protein involved in cysteine biosynthesis